ncbi:MAG: hypothetical protein RL385_816 [Pseudomonadota bacterium]
MVRAERPRRTAMQTLAASLLAAACSGGELTPTEVILLVDSDLRVPEEIDFLDIRVAGPSGPEQDASAMLSADHGLPRRLILRDDSGLGGHLHITVAGRQGGVEVVSRVVDTAFEEGRQVTLHIDLLRSCVGVACGEQTCTASGCADTALSSGDSPDLDGPGAGAAQPAATGVTDAGLRDASVPSVFDAAWAGLDAGDAAAPALGDGGAPDASPPAVAPAPMDAGASTTVPFSDTGTAVSPIPHDGGLRDASVARDAAPGSPSTGAQTACTPSLLCLLSCGSASRVNQLLACACLLECATQ